MDRITGILYIAASCVAMLPFVSKAQDNALIESSIIMNASTGDFAPYFIGSLNHGTITQSDGALLDCDLRKDCEATRRFDYGYGAEILAGATSRDDYMRWDSNTHQWTANTQGPSALWLQQLYAEVKYRSLYISAGMREHTSKLLNPELSSGDIIESGNARPIPEVRGGFHDFVDIPLTDGWVQMQTQLSYGKMTDDNWVKDHYNYYNYHIASGSYYTYKFFYFRTNPRQRFVVTVGMQAASIYGGKCDYYSKGQLIKTNKYDAGVKSMFKMLIPVLTSGEDFVQGSSLGSWDFYGRYSLDNGDGVAAYFQWPFEDGSGIARRNKADGVWGIEYSLAHDGPITGIVLEYIDFRDQSGPILFAPSDYGNPTITDNASGRDDYYNNGYYNSYSNYGMSIGTPFLKSPIYNLNGYPAFESTRANGFHLGVNGCVNDDMKYRVLVQYQRGLGTYLVPYNKVRTNLSMSAECRYQMNDHLRLGLQIAYDKGELRGDNFGALISMTYSK